MLHRTVAEAIAAAEALLPGTAARHHQRDFRWRAIIQVGQFIESNPDEVLSFVLKWGGHEDEDLRSAVATCLLEHLLEHHFDRVVPRLASRIAEDQRFGDMCETCWSFGQAETPSRRMEWQALLAPHRAARSDSD